MFLSKIFKHTRAKVLTALAGLTIVFGAAAAVSTVLAAQQNEVTETKAAGGTVYLDAKTDWKDDSAIFYAYTWDGSGNENWKKMSSVMGGDDLYKADVPYDNLIFVRKDPSKDSGNWDGKWNQTANLTVNSGKAYVMTGWGSGDWQNVYTVTEVYYYGSGSSYTTGSTIATKYYANASGHNTWNKPTQSLKAGYSADGWYTTSGAAVSTSTVTITSARTYRSKYTVIDMYFRVSDDDYALDDSRKLVQSGTFGSGNAAYSGSVTLAANDKFKIANSGWDPTYGANNQDTAGKYFYNFCASPSACFEDDGTGDHNIKCKIAGNYSFTITIFDGGTFRIDSVTRTPGSCSIKYYTVKDGTTTQVGSTRTIWGGFPYTVDQATPSNIYGYTMACWYTQPIAADEYLFTNGTTVNVNLNLYAIYTACAYKTYYFETLHANANWHGNIKIHAWQRFGSTDVAWDSDQTLAPLYSDTDGYVYNAYLPVPVAGIDSYFMLFVDGQGQTDDVSLAGANDTQSCWQISNFSEKYHGSWVAFEAGFKLEYTDGTLAKRMTKGNTNADLAYATNVALSKDDQLKVVVSLSIGGTAMKDKPYFTLGTDEETEHKTTDYATQGATYWTMKSDGTYNFYINGAHNIYVTDANEIGSHGTIYLSNSKGWATVYAYAYYGTNTHTLAAWPGVPLTSIGSTETTENLNYNSHGNLWKIILNNLSGTGGTKATHVVFNNGAKATMDDADIGVSRTGAIALGTSSASPDYYVDLTEGADANITGSISVATAARAAFNIEVAIRGASSSSACNISKSAAEALMADYSAATAAEQTLHQTATIKTWDPASVDLSNLDPATSNTTNISISRIVTDVISPISQGKKPAAFVIPGAPKGDSPLTTTLWIVLGAGVAGLAAIGTAYFVSKKKKRHQA